MSCDCEHPEFFQASRPAARKEHTCCECGRVIPRGTRHRVVSGKWDGELETFRQCARCEGVMVALERQGDECVCFTAVREALHERNRCRKFERQQHQIETGYAEAGPPAGRSA